MVTDMIRTSGLVKRFGDVTALDGLDLVVPKGTVLGLLGPNGAGKTTAVRILTTLLRPDAGSATVAGIDLLREPGKVRERIGLSGQTAAVDEHLTGYENLELVGRLYHLGRTAARERARTLITRFGLDDATDRPAKTYSGGMRRRLDLAAALVATPPVLFLDEPTTGLDPSSRAGLWETIRELVRGGSTLLLTTQYMEEADRLADNIVVTTAALSPREPPITSKPSSAASVSRSSSRTAPTSLARIRCSLSLRSARCRSTTRLVASPPRSTAGRTPCARRCTSCTDLRSPCWTSGCAGPPWTMSF
jgi:ABC-type Na+ transport system ATPase subunit NatA